MELENRHANGSSNALPGAQRTSDSGAGQESIRGLEQEAKQKVEEAREQIHSIAEMGKDRLAEQLEQLARALRSTGESMRSDEQAGELSYVANSVGDRLERASQYLREHRAIDLVDGVERFARERPGIFLGGALVAGLALGRFLKSKPSGESGTGYESGYEGYGARDYDAHEGSRGYDAQDFEGSRGYESSQGYAGSKGSGAAEPYLGGSTIERAGFDTYDVHEGLSEPLEPGVSGPVENVGSSAVGPNVVGPDVVEPQLADAGVESVESGTGTVEVQRSVTVTEKSSEPTPGAAYPYTSPTDPSGRSGDGKSKS